MKVSGEQRFTVSAQERGMRLDRFLALRLAGLSREKIKSLIREGEAGVEGRPLCQPRTALCPGEAVFVRPPASRTGLAPEAGELRIVYRDACLALIDKPAGLTVHPAPGLAQGTLAHRLVAHFPELAGLEGLRPGIVHRLDKDTSGLMLVALTEQCRLALAAMFARHELYKEYLALVMGVPAQAEEEIDAPIGRHPARRTCMAVTPGGRSARSLRRTLLAGRGFSLEAVRIFSGRTHQVRVHMRHLGHPLQGDAAYGGREAMRFARRQMLHAWKLAFAHPFPEVIVEPLPAGVSRQGARLSFCRPPPEDFTVAVRSMAAAPLPVVVTGSPGCGKSSLCRLLGDFGLPLFSADAFIARQYQPGGDAWRLLRSRFGERFVPDDKAPVDKAALARAMRGDNGLRKEVEALVHPLVWHALQSFWREQEGISVAEIPLYLESGRRREETAGEGPILVGVYASFPRRRERLMRGRGWDEAFVAMMESWQWPEDKKMTACDMVVDNTGSEEALAARARDLLTRLEGERKGRLEARVQAFARVWACAAR